MITLSRALKLKNSQAKTVTTLLNRMIANNSYDVNVKKSYDTRKLLNEYLKERDILIGIKILIFTATQPIRPQILRMGELKLYASSLQRMLIKEGEITEGYHTAMVKTYKADIDEAERDMMIRETEDEIQALQDEIDTHNATTQVDL